MPVTRRCSRSCRCWSLPLRCRRHDPPDQARRFDLASLSLLAIGLMVVAAGPARSTIAADRQSDRPGHGHFPASLRALRKQPVFNTYSFGGPLIRNGIAPFIDGRADMYGDAFIIQHQKIVDGRQRRVRAGPAPLGSQMDHPRAADRDLLRCSTATHVGVAFIRTNGRWCMFMSRTRCVRWSRSRLGKGEVYSLRQSLVECMVRVRSASFNPVQEQVRGPAIRIGRHPTVPVVGSSIQHGVANVH